ncbi:MAG: ROK family protein [Desulfurococcaceae archaeon]
MKYYVAVDVGATKTRIALCTAENVLDKVVEQTPREGNEYTVAEFIASTVRTRWKSYLDQVESVGIGTIGPIDIRRGRVVYAPNLPLHTFHLLEPLVEELRKPVYVANDAVAAVWGEKHYGYARNHDNVVYVTMSTGIGVGVIVDGHLLIGKAGNAHEAGHIVVDYSSDLPCGCGGRGHWEAYAGGANIPRLARYVYEKTRVKSHLGELLERGEDITAKTVFDYYRAGDKLAELVVETIVKATAAGLASVINVYDPEIVILGGSVFLNNVDVLYEPVANLVKNNIVTEAPEFKPTSLGDDVGLYGALAVAAYTPETLKKIQHPLIMEILSK